MTKSCINDCCSFCCGEAYDTHFNTPREKTTTMKYKVHIDTQLRVCISAQKCCSREHTHTIYITLNDEHTWIELDQDFLFSLRVHSHSETKAATELGNYIALFSYNPVSAVNFCWNSHYSILFWSCCVFISDWEPPLSLILYAHIWSLNGSAYVITLLTQSKTH